MFTVINNTVIKRNLFLNKVCMISEMNMKVKCLYIMEKCQNTLL